MSAFVVDPTHIDVILSTAINGPRDREDPIRLGWHGPYIDELSEGAAGGPITGETADLAGRALLRECITSVAHRYPGDGPDELPGLVPGFRAEHYVWTDLGARLSAIECCKAIDCYEYQSCEHPGWSGSGAAAFCDRLRRNLVASMSGYREAPWRWDEADLGRCDAQPRQART